MTYPGQPSTALLAKDQIPCWLSGLKVLVGLEEGVHADGIDDTENDEEGQGVPGHVVVDQHIQIIVTRGQ